MRMHRAMWLALLSIACKRPAPVAAASAWPVFPATHEQAEALIRDRTVRSTGGAVDASPEHVWTVAQHAGWGTLPSGAERVNEWIRRQLPKAGRAWLLAGSFHDSSLQVETFGKLIGPGGVGRFGSVALEQLEADGRWQGVDAGQWGDSAVLEHYEKSGSPLDFEALSKAHAGHDYTAWKYDYLDKVLAVVTAAHAQQVKVAGCDAPEALIKDVAQNDALRLRELHCRLALGDTAGPVAMFWGEAHVGPDGFRRFLDEHDTVLALHLIGGRHSAEAPESKLREHLVLNDPLLVPLGPNDAALLLPDRFTGGDVDRSHGPAEPVAPMIVVRADEPGTLRVGSLELRLSDAEQTHPLAPGDYTYCFVSDRGLSMVGTMDLPESGTAALSFEPASRSTRLTFTGPKWR